MILHQWRDFEASGASLERHCFFDRPHDEYATFANKYVRIPGPPHEGVKFIRKWHRLIQEKLQGRTYFSYAVENLDVALGVRICRYLGHEPDDEQRAWARGIPRNLHTNIPASNSPEGMDVPIWPESEV